MTAVTILFDSNLYFVQLMAHVKFPEKIYLINNYYLLMKGLNCVFGMGFVGFLPVSYTFHTLGHLLPGYKTSSGNKDVTCKPLAENSVSKHLFKLI